MKPRLLTPDPTEEEIQHEAYRLWEAEGRPTGRDLDIWLAAKERLKHALHHAAQPGPRNAVHRAKAAEPHATEIR